MVSCPPLAARILGTWNMHLEIPDQAEAWEEEATVDALEELMIDTINTMIKISVTTSTGARRFF